MAERGEGRGGRGWYLKAKQETREDAGVTTPLIAPSVYCAKTCPSLPPALDTRHTRLDKYYFMYRYMNSETVITMFLFSSHTAEVDLGL